MSIEGKVVDAAPGPPDDPQGLQQEIERTRAHLGETVEALVAKVDVKARAQGEATRLMGRLKASAVQARQQAVARAYQARHQVADKTEGPREQVAGAAAGISKATPDPVKQAAGNAAATVRQRRTPLLAAIGAVGAGLVGWLLFQRWRRRG
jgi:Protein of unknown function (DUF3618)